MGNGKLKKGADILQRVIPIVGDAIENKRNENGKPKGKFDWEGIAVMVIRAAVLIFAGHSI